MSLPAIEFLHGFTPSTTAAGRYDLNFGAQQLFNGIWARLMPGREPHPWPFRRIDARFIHLASAFRETVWKLERSAQLYGAAAAQFGPSVLAFRVDHRNQLELSIHLDSVVVYLRMLPDIWAALLPYTYGAPAGHISRRSFRGHREWFLKQVRVDPGYTAILAAHSTWFDGLAGEQTGGVRDLLVHRFAQFHHPVVTEPVALRGQVGSDLSSDSGYDTDAHLAIARVAGGMFRFFDLAVKHHAERIAVVAGWPPLDTTNARAGYMMTFSEEPKSLWLIPSSQT